MAALNYKITLDRGDTYSFGFEVPGGTIDTATFTVWENQNDGATQLFEKDLEDGISEVQTGNYAVRIAPEDTADLEAGRYYYKCRIGANSDVFTIMKGAFVLE